MPKRRSSLLCGLALAICAVGSSRAQATRALEFHATAKVAGFEHPIEIRQSGGRRRVDVATGSALESYITDPGKGVMFVLTDAGPRRLALVFPLAETAQRPLPLEVSEFGAEAAHIGASQVGGRPCALYRFSGRLGKNGTICASSEGIVLALTPDGRSAPLFEVTRLEVAPQDARWFTPPADYQIAVLPALGGAAAPVMPSAAPLDGVVRHP